MQFTYEGHPFELVAPKIQSLDPRSGRVLETRFPVCEVHPLSEAAAQIPADGPRRHAAGLLLKAAAG
jgi:hypothetical protein